MSKIQKDIANIIINIVFVAAFIGIFFFTWGSYIEKNVVQEQVNNVMISLFGDIKNVLPAEYTKMIRFVVADLTAPDMSKEDAAVADSNKKLMMKAFALIVFVLIIGMSIALYLSKKNDFQLVDNSLLYGIIGQNLFILLFIALTEFSFLTFLARNFRSADPNVIRRAIINSLSNFASGKTYSCPPQQNATKAILYTAIGLE
jgi:hypothetical protein